MNRWQNSGLGTVLETPGPWTATSWNRQQAESPFPPPLTSSPFWILLLELMIILCPLSKVTTSATQLGAHEWLIYLQDESENWTRQQWEEHSPLKETNDISIDVLTKHVWRFQSTAQAEWGHFYASKVFWTNGSPASPCRPSCECSINHVVIVHAEHVHTSVLKRRQAIIIVIWSSFTSTHSLCWPDPWSFPVEPTKYSWCTAGGSVWASDGVL